MRSPAAPPSQHHEQPLTSSHPPQVSGLQRRFGDGGSPLPPDGMFPLALSHGPESRRQAAGRSYPKADGSSEKTSQFAMVFDGNPPSAGNGPTP